MNPDGTVQVAVKTIRAFESDDEVLIRKNIRVIECVANSNFGAVSSMIAFFHSGEWQLTLDPTQQ
jgi:hypothetical protein